MIVERVWGNQALIIECNKGIGRDEGSSWYLGLLIWNVLGCQALRTELQLNVGA